MRNLRAGFAYFALVFAAGFALGSIRVQLLVPRIGVRTAELLEMPFMFVAILLAARYVVRHFGLPPGRWDRLSVGITGLTLLLIAEISLNAFVTGQSLADYVASRDPVSGTAYLVMLGLFAVMPGLVRYPPNDPV